MVKSDYKFINFIRFSNLQKWDYKRYNINSILSAYPVEKLGKHIVQQTKKTKLFECPADIFGILGISNDIGMFDAYEEKGENINQAYRVVENNFISYNPYRINVGSIGIKTSDLKNKYISPAYVVVSCKKTLLPEFLFIMMKSNYFNRCIKARTTGSVRQTLSYKNLSEIEVPIPSLDIQKQILKQYNATITKAEGNEKNAKSLEEGIEKILFDELGIEEVNEDTFGIFGFIKFSRLSQWGVEFLTSGGVNRNKKYKTVSVDSLCSVGSGGTPSRTNLTYFNGDIPWVITGEVVDEIIFETEEKITEEAVANSSAKLYPKDSLIIAMYGQGQTRGRTAKLGIDATTNQACAVLHNIDNKRILTDYFWIYMQGEYNHIRALASGNNQPNLNAQMIKDYPVVLPPLEIQNKIADKIFSIKKEIKIHRKKAEDLRENARKEFEQEVFGEQ